MARPKSPPYTLGKLTFSPHPTRAGYIEARGYYRDSDRRKRELIGIGKTQAAARREINAKLIRAREEWRGGDDLLRHDTKVGRAAEIWLEWKLRQRSNGRPLSKNTIRDYTGYVDRCVKGSSLSGLELVEANDVARIEAWLTDIADTRGETAAKQSRKVLGGILGMAERRGAISASVLHRVHTPGAKAGSPGDRKCVDPDCDYDCGKRHLDTRRAFTAQEAAKVQKVADAAKADVGDLTAFLFGTGVRISEALHCVDWRDIDLGGRLVHVRGTKTAQADRVLSMSADLTDRLRERADLHGQTGLVFGVTYFTSKLGQPRDRNNVSKALRRVFVSAGVPWAGSHTFRRTVASWLDEAGAPLAEIANQLGHADTNVTAKYLGRKTLPTRAADVMVLPRT